MIDSLKLRLVVSVVAIGFLVLPVGVVASAAPENKPTSQGTLEEVPISGVSLAGLSESALDESGLQSDEVYLAASENPDAYALAAANANTTGKASLSAATSDSNLLAQLSGRGFDLVRLVGPENGFSTTTISALEVAGYSVDSAHLSNEKLFWSNFTQVSSMTNSVVIGNASDDDSSRVAVLTALGAATPLLLVDPTQDVGLLNSMLTSAPNVRIFVAGNTLEISDSLDATLAEQIVFMPTELDEYLSRIGLLSEAGRNLGRFTVAESDDTGVLGAAGIVAASNNSLPLSRSEAAGLLQVSDIEINSARLVGLNVSTSNLDDLLLLQPARTPLPSWRILSGSPSPLGFTLRYSPVVGAAKYIAYDAMGVEVGESTGTEIEIAGEARPVAIIAENLSGATIRTLQVKLNDIELGEAEVLLGSSQTGNENHLVFIGQEDVPRIVSRTAIPVTGGIPAEDDQVIIRITCENELTDLTSDPTNQYIYTVETVSPNKLSCGAPASGSAIRTSMGLTFPATAYPTGALGSMAVHGSGTMQGGDLDRAASMSRVERLLSERQHEDQTIQGFAAGDGWPNLTFRYQAYIPEYRLYSPGSTGSLTRLFQFFGGDNRGPDPKGSYRYRQDATVKFGSSHNIIYNEWMGTTHKWACSTPWESNCVLQSSAKAPLTELNIRGASHTNTTAKWAFTNSASNPLHLFAPAIDADLGFHLKSGGSVIKGTHDLMPVHEIYMDVDGWDEWQFVYQSKTYFVGCLVGTGLAPGCSTKINIRL